MADIREVPVALAQLCPVVLFCGEPCVLYYIEDHGKILFIWNLDPAVLIRIISPENISQPLQKAQKKDLLQISQKHYLIIINTIYIFRLFVTLSSLFYSCMKLLRRKKLAHKNTWLKVHFKSFTCTLQSVRLCYLQYNTALDEVIEGHLSLPLAVELLYQCAVELVR